MADYWKSQAKKFCDFCKCWIADNKPSVEFHEKGKRHKENVEKRIKEIGQKSRKEHKDSIKVDVEMKKMEEAAMKAYLKDIEGGGDFTSQMLQKEKEERLQEERNKLLEIEKKLDDEEEDEEDDESNEETEQAGSSNDVANAGVKQEDTFPWYEAKTGEGYSYYWHSVTGESVWEEPAEGFLSITEQAAQEETTLKAEKETEEKLSKEEERAKQKEQKLKSMKKEKEEKEREAEESARQAREKMKSRAVKDEKGEVIPFESEFIGPAPRHDPYGGWQTVEKYDETPIDLQLPQQNYEEVNVPVIIDTEPRFKIKEKTIGSIDCEGSSDFKKRKFNSSSKRNMRQRLDDD